MTETITWKVFTDELIDRLQQIFGETYRISAHTVCKNNGVMLHGITLSKEGSNLSPTIYAEDFYQMAQDGTAMEDIAQHVAEFFRKNTLKGMVDLQEFMAYEMAKDAISVRLIHYEKNKELLKDVPHRRYLNLAIVCYYTVEQEPFCGSASILIRNSHIKRWDVDEETLFAGAIEQTMQKYPPRIDNVTDLLTEELLRENGLQDKEDRETPELPLYVLSNTQRMFGAVCMLYPDVRKTFADRIHSDFYILPSSVHEVLLLPISENLCKEELLAMVSEVNATCVEASEILADSVYFYSRETDQIELIA